MIRTAIAAKKRSIKEEQIISKERELNKMGHFLAVRVWQCKTPAQKLHFI
jgi:hypothetical protein